MADEALKGIIRENSHAFAFLLLLRKSSRRFCERRETRGPSRRMR
jgi:hypothetical protein